METRSKRVQWIDILKYICIIFVMISHLEANTKILSTFYWPFFLNGFFFASGYVHYHNSGFKQFFIKKFKGLFIPWLFFSVFNILLAQVLSFNEHYSLVEELKWNFLQIRGKSDGVWFVAALFMAFIPFYFFIEKYEKSGKQDNGKIMLIIAFALSFISNLYGRYMKPDLLLWGSVALPWHIEYVFIAMFWMVLGYLFRNVYETKYDLNVKPVSVAVIFAIYILMTFVPVILEYEIENNILSIIYAYVISLLGVFGLVYVSKKIWPNKYFLYIGQNTLICFALHGKIYSVIQTFLKRFSGSLYSCILANTITSSIFAFLFSVFLSFILIIPIYVINRWFPFLIGRRHRKAD